MTVPASASQYRADDTTRAVGGVLGEAPLGLLVARLTFAQALAVVALLVPVLLAAAWAWHRVKMRFARGATLTLAFLTIAFLYEFLTRPW